MEINGYIIISGLLSLHRQSVEESCPSLLPNIVNIFRFVNKKKFGTLHEFACHPCAGAMLIFSVSFQF